MKKSVFGGAIALWLFAGGAFGSELVLHAPEQSNDGSYILHLEKMSAKRFEKLELYRSINGSEYKLFATVPLFKAISQMVSQNGTYGYKIRGITNDGTSTFSDPVFVKVLSKSISLKHQGEQENNQLELTLGAR